MGLCTCFFPASYSLIYLAMGIMHCRSTTKPLNLPSNCTKTKLFESGPDTVPLACGNSTSTGFVPPSTDTLWLLSDQGERGSRKKEKTSENPAQRAPIGPKGSFSHLGIDLAASEDSHCCDSSALVKNGLTIMFLSWPGAFSSRLRYEVVHVTPPHSSRRRPWGDFPLV